MTLSHSIVGTSAPSLTGYDLNIYFFNGRWLSPIKRYIEADRILPTRVRVNNLPPAAFIVKAFTTYHYTPAPHSGLPPKYYQLFFTSDTGTDTNTWYTPRLSCNLNFICKNDRHGITNRPDFTTFATLHQNQQQFSSTVRTPLFNESDSDHTMYPSFSFNQCPSFSLNDAHKMQIGIEYFLKLLMISFDLRYDSATTQWLDKGPT